MPRRSETDALPRTPTRAAHFKKLPETPPPERIQYLDVLRVLSMLSVVFLHTAAGTLRANYGSSVWHFANALTSLMSASVPIFFMISGALLLRSHKTLSVQYTLAKRVPRVLIPFLVWSLIAIAYYLFVSWRITGSPDVSAALNRLAHLPAKPTTIHLWFMYALIPLYIISPLIKSLIDSMGRSQVLYAMALWAVFSSLLPTTAALLPKSFSSLVILDTKYNLSFLAGYAGYFIAGYYLMVWQRRISARLLWSIIVIDTVCISVGTWWKTGALGTYAELFKTYSGLYVLVLSCALFLLCKELLRERALDGFMGGAVRFLAPLAFGVYLIHNLLVDLVSRIVPWFPAGSVPIMLVSYIVVLAASVACIFLASKLRPLRYALTGLGR